MFYLNIVLCYQIFQCKRDWKEEIAWISVTINKQFYNFSIKTMVPFFCILLVFLTWAGSTKENCTQYSYHYYGNNLFQLIHKIPNYFHTRFFNIWKFDGIPEPYNKMWVNTLQKQIFAILLMFDMVILAFHTYSIIFWNKMGRCELVSFYIVIAFMYNMHEYRKAKNKHLLDNASKFTATWHFLF